jgi:flagellin
MSSTQELFMSFSVNTNNNALAALESLNMTQQAMTKTQNRVSTGLKVAGAADDASTFAIAQGQRGDIAGFQQVSNSLALGSATVNVALQGAQSISDTLNLIKAKVVQGQDPTQNASAIQNDINSYLSQIDSTAKAATFNGVNLITDVNAGTATAANDKVVSSLNTVAGQETAATITVASQNLSTTGAGGLGLGGLNLTGSTVTLSLPPTDAFTGVGAGGDTLSLTTLDAKGVANPMTFEFVDQANLLTAAPANSSNIVIVTDARQSTGQNLATIALGLQKAGLSASFDATGNLAITSAHGFDTSVVNAPVLTLGGIPGPDATLSAGSASTALATVNAAISKVASALSALGTSANQLSTQSNFVKTLTDTLTSGVGTLVDADLAAESANLQALQTKQQLGIQALSIANQGPGAILTLFR